MSNIPTDGIIDFYFNNNRQCRDLLSIPVLPVGKDFTVTPILNFTFRYERLRQEDPNAFLRVKALEGNLLYEGLGLSKEDRASLKNVSVVLHAAGPHDDVLEFCQELPNLKVVTAASNLFRYRGQISETILNEKVPNVPLAIVRLPIVGPVYKEPMPGYVEILKGPTALMIGAGYALGHSDYQAELIPVDLAVNTLLAAAWERGTR